MRRIIPARFRWTFTSAPSAGLPVVPSRSRAVIRGVRWFSDDSRRPETVNPSQSDAGEKAKKQKKLASTGKKKEKKKKKKKPNLQEPPPKSTTGQTGVAQFKARTIAQFEEQLADDEDHQNVQKAKRIGWGGILLGGAALLLFSGAVIYTSSLATDGEFWATSNSMTLLEQDAQVLASLGDPLRSNMGRMGRPQNQGTFQFGGDAYTRYSFPVTGEYRIQGICTVEVKTPGGGVISLEEDGNSEDIEAASSRKGPPVINYLEVYIPTQGKRIKVIS